MKAGARAARFGALFTALVLVAACDREPDDPFDAWLWQFDKKVDPV